MNLTELQDMVLSHQFSDAKYRNFTTQMLNEAQRRVARQLKGRSFFTTSTITTVRGTDTSTLPTDYGQMYSLTETGSALPIRSLSVPEFDELAVTGSSGKPSNYVVDRTQIKFYPIPDAAYSLQLRYFRTPVDLEDGEDEPEIHEDYHHVLVSYALSRCYRRENDYKAADYHMNDFQRELGEMKAELQDDAQDATYPEQVEGMWSGESSVIRVSTP